MEIKYNRISKAQIRLKDVHPSIRGERLLYKMAIFNVHLNVL